MTAGKKLLDGVLILGRVRVELDVALNGAEGLTELVGELVEHLAELLLLLVLADAPLGLGEVLHERLEDRVNRRVECGDGLLRHFTEEHLVIVGDFLVDWLVGVGADKVDALAAELVVRAIGDDELLLAGDVADLAGLGIDAVRLLVVNEDVAAAIGREEFFEKPLSLLGVKGLLCIGH